VGKRRRRTWELPEVSTASGTAPTPAGGADEPMGGRIQTAIDANTDEYHSTIVNRSLKVGPYFDLENGVQSLHMIRSSTREREGSAG
jgi:hypothetical protein